MTVFTNWVDLRDKSFVHEDIFDGILTTIGKLSLFHAHRKSTGVYSFCPNSVLLWAPESNNFCAEAHPYSMAFSSLEKLTVPLAHFSHLHIYFPHTHSGQNPTFLVPVTPEIYILSIQLLKTYSHFYIYIMSAFSLFPQLLPAPFTKPFLLSPAFCPAPPGPTFLTVRPPACFPLLFTASAPEILPLVYVSLTFVLLTFLLD